MKEIKRYYLLLLIFALVISCDQKVKYSVKNQSGTMIFYNVDEYAKFWLKNKTKKVIKIDTFCIQEKKRALKDIEENKLTFFITLGYEKHEFERILKSYGLNRKPSEWRCDDNFGFKTDCYEAEMNEELERRYGKDFFDSIRIVARKQFIKKHPNEVFMEDGRDIREFY